MVENTPWDILDENDKDQTNYRKPKIKIPPFLMETKYFDEMGYKELNILCEKYIDLFNKKKIKDYETDELIRLATLIGNRCSIQAEAEHDINYQTMYYENMRKVSELGLSLNNNHEGLLWNLGVAFYFQEKFEDAVNPFSLLLKIQKKTRGYKEDTTEEKIYSMVICSTPSSYLKSIYKELRKHSENKKILKKIKKLLKKVKEKK